MQGNMYNIQVNLNVAINFRISSLLFSRESTQHKNMRIIHTVHAEHNNTCSEIYPSSFLLFYYTRNLSSSDAKGNLLIQQHETKCTQHFCSTGLQLKMK